jgi:hypothetical protein
MTKESINLLKLKIRDETATETDILLNAQGINYIRKQVRVRGVRLVWRQTCGEIADQLRIAIQNQ